MLEYHCFEPYFPPEGGVLKNGNQQKCGCEQRRADRIENHHRPAHRQAAVDLIGDAAEDIFVFGSHTFLLFFWKTENRNRKIRNA